MSSPLLTYEQVAAWHQRMALIDEEIAHLKTEQSDLQKKLAALAVIFGDIPTKPLHQLPPIPLAPVATPDLMTEAPEPPFELRSQRDTWQVELLSIFQSKKSPLSYEALKAEVEAGHLKGELAKSEKGFYHATARLQKRGVIAKYKGGLMLTTALREHLDLVQKGLKPDFPEIKISRPSPMADAIKLFLSIRPQGATGAEIIAHLKGDSRFSETLTKNNTGGYNVISRLLDRSEVVKFDKTYFAPELIDMEPHDAP